jgi:hypothetical protein
MIEYIHNVNAIVEDTFQLMTGDLKLVQFMNIALPYYRNVFNPYELVQMFLGSAELKSIYETVRDEGCLQCNFFKELSSNGVLLKVPSYTSNKLLVTANVYYDPKSDSPTYQLDVMSISHEDEEIDESFYKIGIDVCREIRKNTDFRIYLEAVWVLSQQKLYALTDSMACIRKKVNRELSHSNINVMFKPDKHVMLDFLVDYKDNEKFYNQLESIQVTMPPESFFLHEATSARLRMLVNMKKFGDSGFVKDINSYYVWGSTKHQLDMSSARTDKIQKKLLVFYVCLINISQIDDAFIDCFKGIMVHENYKFSKDNILRFADLYRTLYPLEWMDFEKFVKSSDYYSS